MTIKVVAEVVSRKTTNGHLGSLKIPDFRHMSQLLRGRILQSAVNGSPGTLEMSYARSIIDKLLSSPPTVASVL